MTGEVSAEVPYGIYTVIRQGPLSKQPRNYRGCLAIGLVTSFRLHIIKHFVNYFHSKCLLGSGLCAFSEQ